MPTARPPHSSAYPDNGGIPVPPFPQLIHQSTPQPSSSTPNRNSAPNRRGSGGPPQNRQGSTSIQSYPQGGHGLESIGVIKSEGAQGTPRGRMASGSQLQSALHVQQSSNLGQQQNIGVSFMESPEDAEDDDASSGDEEGRHDNGTVGDKSALTGKGKKGTNKPANTAYGAGLGSLGLNKEKRKRQVQSCSECRRRKIKCDKKFPCGPCVLRNDQSICREVEKHSPTTTGCASTQDLVHVQQRLAALESILSQAGILAPGQLENILGGKGKLTLVSLDHTLPNGASASFRGTGGNTAPSGSDIVGEPGEGGEGESDTEGAALTLEHLAFGRRKQEQGAGSTHSTHHNAGPGSMLRRNASDMNPTGETMGFEMGDAMRGPATNPFGRPGASTVSAKDPSEVFPYSMTFSVLPPGTTGSGVPAHLLPQVPLRLKEKMGGPVKSEVLDALDPLEVFSLFYQRNDVFVKALLSVLPDRSKGELLVRSYIDKVEWLHRCLHVPTFLNQCEEFWNTPAQLVFTDVYMPFLSLYCIICCLGLYFMDTQEASANFTQLEQESLPEIWCTASRGALWMSDFMAVHTIENLQSIILVGIFLNNHDRADAAWSLLGAAIKMAQGMGLSRLGAEPDPDSTQQPPNWRAPWESVVRRETGRRLWWNLVFLDWSLAPSYNFSSSIQPDQIKTALPSNLDDEDIIDGQPLRPKPISTRTSMSYHLSRMRFAEISQRQIWQANASPHPPYSFILSVDTELRKAIGDLPAYFSFETETPEPPPMDSKSKIQYWEKIIINLSGQSRLMRLHRPWLSRGYKDKRYEYSRDQCIRAARSCLRIMQDEHGVAVFLEKWWIPLFYVTVAGVVVLIDLLRAREADLNSPENEEKEREVLGALNQIKQVQSVSHPARGAIRVWEQLLAELHDRKAGKSVLGKRKADGSDSGGGLQRAVKKLILDAQAVSPGSAGSHAQSTPRTEASAISPTTQQNAAYEAAMAAGPSGDFSNMFMGSQQFPSFPMGVSAAGMPGTMAPAAQAYNQLAQPNSNGNFDVSLESMLATYLPNTNAPSGPDDFMNRVFSFSWDGNPQGSDGSNIDYSAIQSNQYGGWMG